jgi:hypothetical protein
LAFCLGVFCQIPPVLQALLSALTSFTLCVSSDVFLHASLLLLSHPHFQIYIAAFVFSFFHLDSKEEDDVTKRRKERGRMKKRCRAMTLGGQKDDSGDIRRQRTTLTIKN